MSRYHEVAARVAADAGFASYARAHPDDVRAAYGLSDDEVSRLVALCDERRKGAGRSTPGRENSTTPGK